MAQSFKPFKISPVGVGFPQPCGHAVVAARLGKVEHIVVLYSRAQFARKVGATLEPIAMLVHLLDPLAARRQPTTIAQHRAM